MTYKNLLLKEKNNILQIIINRPKQLNALNKETIVEIDHSIESFLKNNNLIGAIITGNGEKAFVAGADISEFTALTKKEAIALSANGHKVFNKIEQSKKPIIACVNGYALGGGCEIAMACHLRIASPNASFGQPEVNLGIIPGYGGTQRLIQLIGKGRAIQLLLTAEIIDAETAELYGLVNSIALQGELINTAETIIQKIAKKAPIAIEKTIHCINSFYEKGVNGFEVEINDFGDCASTDDFKEGASAFLEKRKANFKGK